LGAHLESKRNLIDFVNQKTQSRMNYDTFTVGFARRAAKYKRMDLVFSGMQRLRRIAREVGKVQFIFFGKDASQRWTREGIDKKDLRNFEPVERGYHGCLSCEL